MLPDKEVVVRKLFVTLVKVAYRYTFLNIYALKKGDL